MVLSLSIEDIFMTIRKVNKKRIIRWMDQRTSYIKVRVALQLIDPTFGMLAAVCTIVSPALFKKHCRRNPNPRARRNASHIHALNCLWLRQHLTCFYYLLHEWKFLLLGDTICFRQIRYSNKALASRSKCFYLICRCNYFYYILLYKFKSNKIINFKLEIYVLKWYTNFNHSEHSILSTNRTIQRDCLNGTHQPWTVGWIVHFWTVVPSEIRSIVLADAL